MNQSLPPPAPQLFSQPPVVESPLWQPTEYVSSYEVLLGLPPGNSEIANVLGPMRAQQYQDQLARQRQRAAQQRYSAPYDGPQPTAGEGLQAVGALVVAVVQLVFWWVAFPFGLAWGIGTLCYKGSRRLIQVARGR